MVASDQLREYVQNLRALLAQDALRFGVMVERQIQFALLPHLCGKRADLEQALWELLVLCLEGPEAHVPELTEASWQRAQAAAEAHTNLSGGPAPYPRAAQAVATTLSVLRTVGVYPKPKLMP